MAYSNEYEKMQAEQRIYQSANLGTAQTPAQPYYGDAQTQGNLVGMPSYRPSPLEEAEKRYSRNYEESNKAAEAVAFFRAHPEFAEFISLIRAGSIQI